MGSIAWRRVLVLLAVAAALTAFVRAAAHQREAVESGVPPQLQATVERLLDNRSCMPLAEAERVLPARLEDAGYGQWTIKRGAGVAADGCISVGFSLVDRKLVLIPVVRLEVRQAMDGARDELLRTCLGRDAAVAFLRSVLRDLGEPDARIRTDGPIIIPVEGEEAARRHVASGCYVYSGVLWDAEGEPVYAIGGQ
jgi:hypothetical protein